MTRVQRQAVLLSLINALRRAGSWCGETHIQKTGFFLQDGLSVPLDFNFILYKHGPYSFDLNDELTALRADELLAVHPQEPYGAHLYPGPAAETFLARFPATTGRHAAAVAAVVEEFGRKTVTELERYATALYVLRYHPGDPDDRQAARINQFKPHVSLPDARAALEVVRAFIRQPREPASVP